MAKTQNPRATRVSAAPGKTREINANGKGHEGGWELELLAAMMAFRKGDFSARLPEGWTGVQGKIGDAFNDVLSTSERRSREVARVARVVGKEGRVRQRMAVAGTVGGWADEVEALNALIDDLVRPTTEVTRTI